MKNGLKNIILGLCLIIIASIILSIGIVLTHNVLNTQEHHVCKETIYIRDTSYFWMMRMRNRAYYSTDSLYHLYVDSTWNFTNNMPQAKSDSLGEILKDLYGPILK